MNTERKKRSTMLLIGLLLMVWSGSVPAQNDAEREVRKLEGAWLNAYETRDAKAMDEIVGDDFVITFPDGTKQTKPELMAQIRKTSTFVKGSIKFHTEDVKARVTENTIVLTGRVITERLRDGQTISSEESLYTDTYVKRNGRWQVVESHLSIPKTGAK